MSKQHIPLTDEKVLEMFRQVNRRMGKIERTLQELSQKVEATEWGQEKRKKDNDVPSAEETLGRLDRLFESKFSVPYEKLRISMFEHKIDRLFRQLGYFGDRPVCITRGDTTIQDDELGIHIVLDFIIDGGGDVIIFAVSTDLGMWHVRNLIVNLRKHRCHIDAKGGDKRRYIGAIASAVITDNVTKFAQENGLYVVVQSDETLEIVTPPEGFVAKEW